MIDLIINKLKSIISRGVLHKVADDGGRQFCQVSLLKNEVKNGVERIQAFGHSSVPPPDTAVIVAFVGADRGRPIIIGDNHSTYRKKGLNAGENALYDAFGQYLYFKNDGSIEVKTGGTLTIKSATKVRMETPVLEVTGDIIDNVDGDGQSMASMRAVFNIHTHKENDAPNDTNTPTQTMGGGA